MGAVADRHAPAVEPNPNVLLADPELRGRQLRQGVPCRRRAVAVDSTQFAQCAYLVGAVFTWSQGSPLFCSGGGAVLLLCAAPSTLLPSLVVAGCKLVSLRMVQHVSLRWIRAWV